MRILHRYICFRYVFFVIGAVLLFSFLYIIGDIFGHLEDIFKNHVPIRIVVSYYLSMVPLVLVNTFPLASILAGLYVVGDMNYANEIISIRSSGLPTRFILFPMIVGAWLVCSIMFFVNERFVPSSALYTSSIKQEFIKRNTANQKNVRIKNLTFYGEDNALYFISEYYPDKALMRGVVILFQDQDQRIREKWIAEEGFWREGKWCFKNLVIYQLDEKSKVQEGKRFFYSKKVVKLTESPRDMLRKEDMIESLNIRQLLESINRLRHSDSKDTLLTFRVQLIHRIITAVSPLVLLFAGIPLALPIRRKPPGFSAFGQGIIIFLLYYVVDTVALGLARSGIVPPELVLGSVPFLFLSFSFTRIFLIP